MLKKSNSIRYYAWSAAAVLLLLPLIAMQFTNEVNWDAADFALFAAMLLITGGAIELAVKLTKNKTYRLAAGALILSAFFLVWLELAVGILD